jgi:predicted MPP superfamily phosphohydrolase
MSFKADVPVESNLNPKSTKTVTWLHLSDLHACKPKTGWDANRVTEALCKDLKEMQEKYDLRPDLIFFTGDAAYGHLGHSDGKSITEQFREAHVFFTTVRESFKPPIEQRNFFLVPGNHDVNRSKISKLETQALGNIKSLDEITSFIKDGGLEWKIIMRRLDDYAHFLETCGYDHLLTDRDRLIYADARECNGLRVGIAGFNSAWSSRGIGREEIGRLWMAGRFQLETLKEQMPPNDFQIALLHHPSNWLSPEENSIFGQQLKRDFPFVLHGHEHQDYISSESLSGHTVISAGACHEWSESRNNGYNFVRLDFSKGRGDIWLRQYNATGAGWIPRIIPERTDDRGCWPLDHFKPWMGKLIASEAGNPPEKDSESNIPIEILDGNLVDRKKDYEVRYRKAVAKKLDYIGLFGIELRRRESREYSLTVAYVSLNLDLESQEDIEELDDDVTAATQTTFPAEKGRLLIRGVAGSGKTTLLRWAAIQSTVWEQPMRLPIERGLNEGYDTTRLDPDRDWRHQIPFIIRLRDFTDGQLPRPNQFPLLLAKELPDPPTEWIDDILINGRALVMFDGVDEVPPQVRDATMREIRDLINAYPANYYVVTTRPEAVEKFEFIKHGFISACVEPMAVNDRNDFIDRWHDAMELQLRNWNEYTDLRPLAKRLKHRLEANPAIARLTSNPLLCAVVCTLHRERNENLPETPIDLCEKLCAMLLNDRDQARFSTKAHKWIYEAYGKLDFQFRKGVLSQLAYHMIDSGISAITEIEADRQITKSLNSYKLNDNVKAGAIRRALVERSGILQESSDQKIEFLHNTLKEYLAAERFVNKGDLQVLADHAHEASWQPVILFAVALPRDGSEFATNLLYELLLQIPSETLTQVRSKEAKLEVAKVKAQQFFFIQCFANAYQVDDSTINQAFDNISKQLLPPQNTRDAISLASCGEAIIPYLENRKELKVSERAACVRALGLISNQQSSILLKGYLNDPALSVAEELVGLFDDWNQILSIRQYVQKNGCVPSSILKKLKNISSLYNLNNLTRLEVWRAEMKDISALASLPNLTEIDMSEMQIYDISFLINLASLVKLDISRTSVRDISALSQLTKLEKLNLSHTSVRDISALSQLTKLEKLNLSHTSVSDISALSQLINLKELDISDTSVRDASALSQHK